MASLKHHGIKGQEWGVKHGPPYPLDKNTSIRIKKGASIGHIDAKKKIKLQNRGIYGYDQNDSNDRAVYRGIYAKFTSLRNKGKLVYDQNLVAKEDLLLPSQKEKVKAFEDLCNDNAEFKQYIELVDTTKIFFADYEQELKKWYDKCGITRDTTYGMFMHSFNRDTSKEGMAAAKAFTDKLSSMGYNAMIDDNDAGIYNGAEAPLYVFDAKKSLDVVGREKIKSQEMVAYMGKVKQKQGTIFF